MERTGATSATEEEIFTGEKVNPKDAGDKATRDFSEG